MQKLRLTLIPMSIGSILLLLSWYLSYPVSMNSPYDFIFNEFSYLYWLGLSTLFASFFIVTLKTENNKLRWAMTLGTFFLMFSQTYFYYMVSGSDTNQFRGLTEYFISTGDLSGSKPYHSYFEWPLFFLLNKAFVTITGLGLRYCEFILYTIMGFVFTSFLYIFFFKARKNAYISTIVFFIILFAFFNFQFWTPFMFSICLIFLLFYLDGLPEKLEVNFAILTIFVLMTFTHILTPVFFILYSFLMYILKKNSKYLIFFIGTSVVYILFHFVSQNILYYAEQLAYFSFLDYFFTKVAAVAVSSMAMQTIETVAQYLARITVVATALCTFFGFILLIRKTKLRATDYAMLIAGLFFAATLVIAPSGYSQVSNRSFFLFCIPLSFGASYLFESKFKKYFKPLFLVILILFTFVLVNLSFFDQEIFYQTKTEYLYANFLINTINWNNSVSIVSPFRFEQYIRTRSSSENVTLSHYSRIDLPEDITSYNFIVYNLELAKNLVEINFSIAESFEQIDNNHYNLIYNSGDFSLLFSKAT